MEGVRKRSRVGGKRPPRDQTLFTTTEGRQWFPDLLQTTYGEKAILGFDRYGRPLGAVVPMEAVQMLAGNGGVAEDVRNRIQRTAQSLLVKMAEAAERERDPELVDIEEVEAARRTKPGPRKIVDGRRVKSR